MDSEDEPWPPQAGGFPKGLTVSSLLLGDLDLQQQYEQQFVVRGD